MLRGKKLLLYLAHILCVSFVSSGCGPTPVRSETKLIETDPFVAAARQASLQRWQVLMAEAERLVLHAAVPPEQLESMTNQLRRERDRALRDQGNVLPLEIRRRSAQLIAHLEHLRRMTATPARFSRRGPQPTRRKVVFDWPVRPPRISSGFGLRKDPFSPGLRSFHNGIDLVAPEGTPVFPTADGEVVEAGFRDDGCGLAVTLVHPNGYASDYCHLATVNVEIGQRLSRADALGSVGSTGRSTGSHLHWSVWKLGSVVDPRRVLGREDEAPD